MDFLPILATLAILASVLVPATKPMAQSSLPTSATERAIGSLAITPTGTDKASNWVKQLRHSRAGAPPSPTSSVTNQGGPERSPFVIPDTMIVQFKPDTSSTNISDFLEKRQLKVVETYPKLGAVKVEADLSKYFSAQQGDANETMLRGVNAAIKDFTSDSIVRSASPDVLLRKQDEPSVVANFRKPSQSMSLDNVTSDWGVANIEADKLWDLPGAQDGILFGVLDAGFARHEDLVFMGCLQQCLRTTMATMSPASHALVGASCAACCRIVSSERRPGTCSSTVSKGTT